jgi:hypothetical protein
MFSGFAGIDWASQTHQVCLDPPDAVPLQDALDGAFPQAAGRPGSALGPQLEKPPPPRC